MSGALHDAVASLIQQMGLEAAEQHLNATGSPAARQEFKRQRETLLAADLSKGNTPAPVVREQLIATGISRRTAYRLHGIRLKSEALNMGGVTAAAFRIAPRASIYEFVGEWRAELVMLDELHATKTKLPSVLIHAALLTLRKRGRKALEFWSLYLSDAGTKQDGKSDGVQKLCDMVALLRASKKLAKGNEAEILHQAARAVSCCESWLSGEMYAGSVKFTHLDKYLPSQKKPGDSAA